MAVKYGRKKHRQNTILYTLITIGLLCVVFLSMVRYFYVDTENDAYEQLHLQTKQIKDDLSLQLLSDRENLMSMANFAAKLYADGEDYGIMLESFKPIGLLANIGILRPDNTFVTRAGTIDLNGAISFEEEAEKSAYISGRVKDLTKDGLEIVRTAVPIVVNDKTVGILYGVIKLDALVNRYKALAEELNAQLFVYDEEKGNFVIDSVRDKLGNVSELKDRVYMHDFSYEKMMQSDKGYTSFVSAYSGEILYIHYSPIETIGWKIMLARPESQVFAKAHTIFKVLIIAFLLMSVIVVFYLAFLMQSQKRMNLITMYASKIRKLLLEINQQQNNISEALKALVEFSKARSAMFFDADGEYYKYTAKALELLSGDDKKYFIAEVLHYAAELHNVNKATLSMMCITPNAHLLKTNPEFYKFLKRNKIKEISFATIIDKNNHVGILGVLNPCNSKAIRNLLEDIAVCFSIAIYNKKHLNKTELAAITDSLTGASNRVKYKRDILSFDEIKPEQFACVYIDVNELHLRNNLYGHAAGDEMLIYIANTLKEVFYGHNIYRMGGDEFLVFTEKIEPEAVRKGIELLFERLKPMGYHVATGMSYRTQNTNTEEMVREAEVRMYEAKTQYYQDKENKGVVHNEDSGYVFIKTDSVEIKATLSVIKEHYMGICSVSLDTDKARRVMLPSYLGYGEEEEKFSSLFTKFLDEEIEPDCHRAVTTFLNYDILKSQLAANKVPRITFKKVNGENIKLTVYKLNDESVNETLWVFEKSSAGK